MSDERQLTKEDRVKIARLLESGTPENVTLALSLIEETAGQKDIAEIFTMNVIVELICLGDPVLQAASIMRKCPNTSKVFVKALTNQFIMTSRNYRSRNTELSEFTMFSSSALAELVNAESDIDLTGLTSLSNAAAESLSKHEGNLYLRGPTELSDAAAESLSKHKGGNLTLSGLKYLSDAAAESLSKYKGHLTLYGLTSLSDAAAESLSKHKGGNLALSGLKNLSDAVAESLSKHEGTLDLDGLTSLSDAAAESLSKYEGDIWLRGLTSRSDGSGHIALAESLGKHGRNLYLDSLTELSDAAAESLSKHERSEWDEGDLYLNGLTKLSDAAAESLSKLEGDAILAPTLYLNGLTELSDAAAESLSKFEGYLELNGLTKLSDASAESLGKYTRNLCLYGLNDLSDTAAIQLASHNYLCTSTKIERQIKKAVSERNQQARKSAKTGQTALTKKQSVKLRKLFRSKDADNVLIAVELIDASEATQDDINDVLSSSVLSLLVNTWDVRVWNALAPLLLSDPNAKREFTELVNRRVGHQVGSNLQSNGFVEGFYRDVSKPLALLDLIIPYTLGCLTLNGLTELSDAAAENLSKFQGSLDLSGLIALSDAAAEILSKHEGDLYLCGLMELSDAAAKSLAKREIKFTGYQIGCLYQINLDNFPASAAKILRDAGHGV